MEKASIRLRTCFVNNWNFRKCIYKSFYKLLKLLWKLSLIGYKYAKYSISKKNFSYLIRFYSSISENNLPQSINLHNFKKIPRTMSVFPCISPCLSGSAEPLYHVQAADWWWGSPWPTWGPLRCSKFCKRAYRILALEFYSSIAPPRPPPWCQTSPLLYCFCLLQLGSKYKSNLKYILLRRFRLQSF